MRRTGKQQAAVGLYQKTGRCVWGGRSATPCGVRAIRCFQAPGKIGPALLLIPLLAPGSLLAVPVPSPPAIDSPKALIEAMHARYDGRWFETLTFVQTSIRHKPDGAVATTLWYEALHMPGKLRIEFDPAHWRTAQHWR